MEDNTIEHHGPERSFTGHNAHHFDCSVVGHRPTYFVCLHKMKRYAEQGNLPDFAAECEQAMKSKRCVAVHMREEELLAGKSLYFEARKDWEQPIARMRQVRLPSLSSLSGTPSAPASSTPSVPRPSTPAPQPAPQRTVQNLDFAQIVTELASKPTQEMPAEPPSEPVAPPKAVEAPVAPPQPKTAPSPAKTGESMLELARRLKRAKAAVTTD